jgi:hypothetical protein
MTNCYRYTKYPEIYKKTCWSVFTKEENASVITEEIYANRNKFIEDFNIVDCKYKYKYPKYVFDEFHNPEINYLIYNNEYYVTSDKKHILIINSYKELKDMKKNYMQQDGKKFINYMD